MSKRKEVMSDFMLNFKDMPDRLLKYCEILLEGKDASPVSYQDTMSFRRLAIELNTKCNLNCAWCFRLDPNFKHILNKQMTIETLKKIINNTKGKFRMVVLGGLGEPLMYPHFLEAIKLAKKLSSNIKTTTNATLLTKELIDNLVESGLTHLEMSIDVFGRDGNYNIDNALIKKFRIRHTDPHRLELIKYINDKNVLNLQINSVLLDINYNSLKNMVEVLKDFKNIKILHFIPLFTTKQLRDIGIDRISDEKYMLLLKSIQGDIKKYNLKWEVTPSSLGTLADPIIQMKKRKNICFTCFEDPYISIEGKLLPCGRQKIWGGVDATIGFEKAWNHPKILEFRKNMLNGNYPELCGNLCYLKEKPPK